MEYSMEVAILNNPNGPYPGRQIFVGLTPDSRPCFAYLVTGRSPESRERKAVANANTIYMGPLGEVAYDPLRHYSAVKYDAKTGILAVSNGIQTEAVYELYKLLFNVGTFRSLDSWKK
jgi:IMP cyclohydrolase